jgi:hypothetical protein
MAKKRKGRVSAREKRLAAQEHEHYEFRESAAPVVVVVNLLSISAREFSAVRKPIKLDPDEGLRIDISVTDITADRSSDGESFEATILCGIKAHSNSVEQATNPVVEMSCRFALLYGVKSFEGLVDENLYSFALTSGVFSVWPYWREFVHASSLRLGLEPFVLPTYKQ